MLFVGAALLIFADSERIYAGFSGIILGWYALWLSDNIVLEKGISKKVEMLMDGIIFINFLVIVQGRSILMHLSGLLAGAVGFRILKRLKVNKEI